MKRRRGPDTYVQTRPAEHDNAEEAAEARAAARPRTRRSDEDDGGWDVASDEPEDHEDREDHDDLEDESLPLGALQLCVSAAIADRAALVRDLRGLGAAVKVRAVSKNTTHCLATAAELAQPTAECALSTAKAIPIVKGSFAVACIRELPRSHSIWFDGNTPPLKQQLLFKSI